MHFCSPLCGACPTVSFHVACPECRKTVLGAVEKCSQCGAPLPRLAKFCLCHAIDCDMPCRHWNDPHTQGKRLACRKFNPTLAVREEYKNYETAMGLPAPTVAPAVAAVRGA